MNLSIRHRLTLAYSVALGVALAAAGLAVVAVHSRLSVARLDEELGRLADTVASVLQNELNEGLAPRAAAEDALGEVRAPGRGLVIQHNPVASGSSRTGSEASVTLAQSWPAASTAGPFDHRAAEGPATVDLSDGPWRMSGRMRPPVPSGYAVIALAPIAELDADRATLRRALTIILPLALVFCTAGGWWIAGRALRPAARMAEEAHHISEHSTGTRLTVERRDELGQLAGAFNALLDRLEHALEARRQFLADASHELRTPVSVARMAADAALAAPTRSNDEYRDSLGIVTDQMKRLGRIIGDMLLLARNDAERWPLQTTDFYAEELASECVRAMSLLAADRQVGITFDATRDLQVTADEELLRQMIVNLIENAVLHTPSGEVVHVDVVRQDGMLSITVHDRGPGIAEADRQRIFDRFVRTGSSGRDGLGLGLAIARRIARAHGGDVTVVSTGPDGTVFRASFPLGSSQ